MRGKKLLSLKVFIVSLLGVSAVLLMGSGIFSPVQAGQAERVTLGTTNVEGKLVRATEMGEGYFLSVEQKPGRENRVVLTLTPESEIRMGETRRTPDDFIRLAKIGEEQVRAVYFINAEGMKHVLSITAEGR